MKCWKEIENERRTISIGLRWWGHADWDAGYDLYDESDFISNIKGEYRDKNYLEWAPITEENQQNRLKSP